MSVGEKMPAASLPLTFPRRLPRMRLRGWEHRVGLAFLLLLGAASAAVRLLGIGDPTEQNLDAALQPPSAAHVFGTDNLGRDVLLRTLYATWTDISLGVAATATSVVVGLLVGVLAGYSRGAIDGFLMRLTDAVIAFPFLILSLAIIAISGPGSLVGIYLALLAKGWPQYARIARAETLRVREQGFMLAARTMGLGHVRILGRHLLPNVWRPCLAFSFSDLVVNILLIATLSFLGLGVQPPAPEWGSIMAEGQTYILTSWWITTLPGVVVVLFGVAVAFIGDSYVDSDRAMLEAEARDV